MKIIKQNDSSGGLIFKQNTGGKAMKQNYNFGKSFAPKGAAIYLESPYVPAVNVPFSIVTRHRNFDGLSTNAAGPIFLLRNSNNNGITSFIRYRGPFMLSYSYPLWNSGATPTDLGMAVSWINKNPILCGVRSDGVNLSTFINTAKSNATYPVSSLPQTQTTNLYLCRTQDTTTLYESARNNEVIIYERYIDDVEIGHFYNNGLGNEPLNSNFKVRLMMDKAEILPYLGVDSVCVRDVSANENHCKIIGLPAGSLQDQVDYANNNLFL